MLNVYVAGPFSGTPEEIEQNILNAQIIAVAVWKCGGHAVVPHVMSHRIAGEFPEKFWLKEGIYRLTQCDALIRLPNHEKSKGTAHEWEMAGLCGLVRFDAYTVDPDPLISLPKDLRDMIAGVVVT